MQARPNDASAVLSAAIATVPIGAAAGQDDRRRAGAESAERDGGRATETGLCRAQPTALHTDTGRSRAGAVGEVRNTAVERIDFPNTTPYTCFLKHQHKLKPWPHQKRRT